MRSRVWRDLALGRQFAVLFADDARRGVAVKALAQCPLDLGFHRQRRQPVRLLLRRRAAAQQHQSRPKRPRQGHRRLGRDAAGAARRHDHIARRERRARAAGCRPGRAVEGAGAGTRQTDFARTRPQKLLDQNVGGLVRVGEIAAEVHGLALHLRPLPAGRLRQAGKAAVRGLAVRVEVAETERPVQARNGSEKGAAFAAGPTQTFAEALSDEQGALQQAVVRLSGRGGHHQPAECGRRRRASQLGDRRPARAVTFPPQPLLNAAGQLGVVRREQDFGARREVDRPASPALQGYGMNHAAFQRDGRRAGGVSPLILHRFRDGCGIRGMTPPARRRPVSAGEEGGDVAEGEERTEVFGLDLRCLGQAFLQGRQDLDALDRVDAQVGVQSHVQLQHLRRIARLLRDHLQQRGGNLFEIVWRGRLFRHFDHRLDRGGRRRGGAAAGEEGGDVAEAEERTEVFGLDLRRLGQAFLQGRQDLDALDRVDAQVGVQSHVQLQHLRRIARLLRDHLQKNFLDSLIV